jgi:hypothetical protein
LGLCVVAILAVAAAVAGTASAVTPEWGQCFAKAGGKYTNASCTTKGKGGSFEWRKGTEVAKKGFTGAGGVGILEDDAPLQCVKSEPNGELQAEACVNGETGKENPNAKGSRENEKNGEVIPAKVECKTEHASGEASGKNDVKNVNVTFTGCIALGSFPCSNTATSEEIKTTTLKGALGYLNKSKHEVGVSLEPETKGGLFAKFSCTIGLSFEVGVPQGKKQGKAYYGAKGGGDSVISPITPVNEMSSSFTQVYSINEKYENTPDKFEGKKLDVLETAGFPTELPKERGLWGAAGEEITNVNTPEEAVEIKA